VGANRNPGRSVEIGVSDEELVVVEHEEHATQSAPHRKFFMVALV
jgi:hypothetical protein